VRRGIRQSSLFTVASLIFLAINCSVSAQTTVSTKETVPQVLNAKTLEIINIDGDVSLDTELNRIYWNPHSTGLTSASTWEVTFKNETEIFMKTTEDEAGHVAAGAWWTTSFKSKEKLPLCDSRSTRFLASFRVNVASVELQSGQEWLRIALACAIQRVDGSVVYTEMDFYDSPSVLTCPFGNIMSGGNVVYKGGDVIEHKIDQITTGEWKGYSLDLTSRVDSAWSLTVGDTLESVYIVVEAIGKVTAVVKIDDLWITQVG
jgi:hypothetical protein